MNSERHKGANPVLRQRVRGAVITGRVMTLGGGSADVPARAALGPPAP